MQLSLQFNISVLRYIEIEYAVQFFDPIGSFSVTFTKLPHLIIIMSPFAVARKPELKIIPQKMKDCRKALQSIVCFEHNVFILKAFMAACHAAHAGLHSMFVVPHLTKNGVVNVTLADFSTTMHLGARNTYLLFIGHGHLFGTLPKRTDVIILNDIAATSAPEIIIISWCFAWPHFAWSRSIYMRSNNLLGRWMCGVRCARPTQKVCSTNTYNKKTVELYLFSGFSIDFSPSSQLARIMRSSQSQHVPIAFYSCLPKGSRKLTSFSRTDDIYEKPMFRWIDGTAIGYRVSRIREQLVLTDKSYLHICILFDLENFRIEVSPSECRSVIICIVLFEHYGFE